MMSIATQRGGRGVCFFCCCCARWENVQGAPSSVVQSATLRRDALDAEDVKRLEHMASQGELYRVKILKPGKFPYRDAPKGDRR